MINDIRVPLLEVALLLIPAVVVLSILVGVLVHIALRRPDSKELARLFSRVRSLEADHSADLAQIASFREQIFYLGRIISKLADIMDIAGLVLPDEVYTYLKRQGNSKPPAAFDPELAILVQHALDQFFSLDELRQLSFEVGVDFDNLAGSRKEDKSRSLVLFMDRRGQLEILIDSLMAIRPNLPFPWVESRGPP